MRRTLQVVASLLVAAVALTAPAVASAGKKKVDCTAPATPGVDFHGCNLSHRQFEHANFTGANLTDVNFTGASLFNAVLFGAGMNGANLTDANLATANLTEADLDNATIKGATIVQTDFAETSLNRVASGDLHGRPTSLPGRFFTKRGILFGPGVDLSGSGSRASTSPTRTSRAPTSPGRTSPGRMHGSARPIARCPAAVRTAAASGR